MTSPSAKRAKRNGWRSTDRRPADGELGHQRSRPPGRCRSRGRRSRSRSSRPGSASTGPSTGISSGRDVDHAGPALERADRRELREQRARRPASPGRAGRDRAPDRARGRARTGSAGRRARRRRCVSSSTNGRPMRSLRSPHLLLERRQKNAEMAQRCGRDVEGAGAAARERVAAVQAAAERGPGRADRALGDQGPGRGALHRGLDLELRQLLPVVAQEQRRPGAARQHDGAAGDPPVLGHDARDLAARDVSSARTAQRSWMPAPSAAAARASAGTASAGSARASLGVNKAPLNRRPSWPSSASVAAGESRRVSS